MEVGQGPNWDCSAKGKKKLLHVGMGRVSNVSRETVISIFRDKVSSMNEYSCYID
jgi:hypothetical protein